MREYGIRSALIARWQKTKLSIEGFARNNEFLYIVITNAPDHEVLV